MKYLVLFSAITILTGCSLTLASHKQISTHEYIVKAEGNAFSSTQDIEKRLHEEAFELCGHKGYKLSAAHKSEQGIGMPLGVKVASGEAKVSCR